jgi:hypothetical protein
MHHLPAVFVDGVTLEAEGPLEPVDRGMSVVVVERWDDH